MWHPVPEHREHNLYFICLQAWEVLWKLSLLVAPREYRKKYSIHKQQVVLNFLRSQ